MPGWMWIAVAAVAAIGVLALVWWTSGRARVGQVDPSRRSPQQRMEIDVNRVQTMRTRDGMGPLP
jgi:hypothetical protein